MVSRALRPSLPTSSNFKCLGDLATEVRGPFVGSVEMLWVVFFFFLPVGQSLNLVLQNSGKLVFFFFLFSLSLYACVFWWLMKLFMVVSKASGKAVWPVCHELDKNGDIQLSVPCSCWVFYINWIIGCFNRPRSGCSRERSVASIDCVKVSNSCHCLCMSSFTGCLRDSWALWKDSLSELGASSS